jgi:hypothetical protein
MRKDKEKNFNILAQKLLEMQNTIVINMLI